MNQKTVNKESKYNYHDLANKMFLRTIASKFYILLPMFELNILGRSNFVLIQIWKFFLSVDV